MFPKSISKQKQQRAVRKQLKIIIHVTEQTHVFHMMHHFTTFLIYQYYTYKNSRIKKKQR